MEQLTGDEEFTIHEHNTGIKVKEFWSWAFSDLLNNTQRGVMAEYLVYTALKSKYPNMPAQVREDWLPFDISSPSGRRIEVKSAAYLQSWTTDFLSQIQYDIAPKLAWDGKNYASEAKRNCDLFVFCLYTALTRDKSILDLNLWEFYILPTSVLDTKIPKQKSIALSSLLKLEPIKTDYANLATTIESIRL